MAIAVVQNKLPVSTLPANIMPGTFSGIYVGHRTQLALLQDAALGFNKEVKGALERNKNELIKTAPSTQLPLVSNLLEEVGFHGVRWLGLQRILGYYKKG